MIVRPEQPDEESRARTHLANERTFLAWFRTGITLIALGLAAAQFLTLESSGGFPIVHVLASILVLTGIALALTGAARYLAGRQHIEAMDFQPAYRSILATTVAAVIVGLIAIAFVWLVRPMP
jgi:putative membrane protein